MSDNLIARLIPHQGCVITPKDDAIEIAGSAMNWVMSAAVAPIVCRAPCHLPRRRQDGFDEPPHALAPGRTDLRLGMLSARAARSRSCDGRAAQPQGQGVPHDERLARTCRGRSGSTACASIVDGDVKFDGAGNYLEDRIQTTFRRSVFGSTRSSVRLSSGSRRYPETTRTWLDP